MKPLIKKKVEIADNKEYQEMEQENKYKDDNNEREKQRQTKGS